MRHAFAAAVLTACLVVPASGRQLVWDAFVEALIWQQDFRAHEFMSPASKGALTRAMLLMDRFFDRCIVPYFRPAAFYRRVQVNEQLLKAGRASHYRIAVPFARSAECTVRWYYVLRPKVKYDRKWRVPEEHRYYLKITACTDGRTAWVSSLDVFAYKPPAGMDLCFTGGQLFLGRLAEELKREGITIEKVE